MRWPSVGDTLSIPVANSPLANWVTCSRGSSCEHWLSLPVVAGQPCGWSDSLGWPSGWLLANSYLLKKLLAACWWGMVKRWLTAHHRELWGECFFAGRWSHGLGRVWGCFPVTGEWSQVLGWVPDYWQAQSQQWGSALGPRIPELMSNCWGGGS